MSELESAALRNDWRAADAFMSVRNRRVATWLWVAWSLSATLWGDIRPDAPEPPRQTERSEAPETNHAEDNADSTELASPAEDDTSATAPRVAAEPGNGDPSSALDESDERREISRRRRVVKTPTPPDWVKPHEFDVTAMPREPENLGGMGYLACDDQVDTASRTRYSRRVMRFLAENGVQENSQITITFDPTYQTLRLHRLAIYRSGVWIDRMNSQSFKVIERESAHERQLYDGRLSAIALIEDVRVGDVLEYAYSIEGTNPVFGNRVVRGFALNWAVPVAHLWIRLRHSGIQPLQIKAFNSNLQPEVSQENGTQVYEWSAQNVPAVLSDGELPIYVTPYAHVSVSDYPSWKEVVEWALEQYPRNIEVPEELERRIEEIRRLPTQEAQVLAALRYVQDEIRYLGLFDGIHSFKPYPIELVLKRRFGDCKDKSMLLSTVLRRLGFEAHPALVETQFRHTIENWLPSPTAFDHLVVQLKLDGEIYWLDGTRSHQRGPLKDMYLPAYGRALVVSAESEGLETIELRGHDVAQTEVHESFRLADYAGAAQLSVTTRYSGFEAEGIRAYFASRGRDSVEKSYLNYYSKYYPTISIDGPMGIDDDEENNVVVVHESYKISALWEPSNSDDDHIETTFYAGIVSGLITTPTTRVRTMPFGVSVPEKTRQVISVHFPTRLALDQDRVTIENAAFRFEHHQEPVDNSLVLRYDYRALSDQVPASETRQYLSDANEASDSATTTIWVPAHYADAIPADEDPNVDPMLPLEQGLDAQRPFDASPPFVALLALLLGAAIGVLAYRATPPLRRRPLGGKRYRYVDRSLVVALLFFVARPLYSLAVAGVIALSGAQGEAWWQLLHPEIDDFRPLRQVCALFAIAFYAFSAAFEVALVVLLLSCRYTLPFITLVYHSLTVITAWCLWGLPAGIGDPMEWPLVAAVLSTSSALVWCPYFAFSSRARRTLVAGRPRPPVVAPPTPRAPSAVEGDRLHESDNGA